MSKFPSSLTQLKQWVNVENKIPYNPLEVNKFASVNDPATWSTYQDAIARVNKGNFKQIGFVFCEEDGIVGIDIDSGTDENGLLNEWCCSIISLCHSYTELSQNNRGVHIFLKGKLPTETGLTNKDEQHRVEIFQSGKQFVMTGKTLIGGEIIENQEAIDYIIDTYFVKVESGEHHEPFCPIKQQVKVDGKKISVEIQVPEIIEGSRNDALLSIGRQLTYRGYNEEKIYKTLSQINLDKCKPPLEDDEIKRIVRSVMKYARKTNTTNEPI